MIVYLARDIPVFVSRDVAVKKNRYKRGRDKQYEEIYIQIFTKMNKK